MPKTTFKKMNLKKNNEVKTIYINNDEGLPVEIKQYLPMNEKLELLERVINSTTMFSNFYNPGQLQTFLKLEIVYTYTNIVFTEKQQEDFLGTYDLLEQNNIFDEIFKNIPEEEVNTIRTWCEQTVKAIYEYNMSIYGVVQTLQRDYNNLNFDFSNLQKQILNPENLALIKNIGLFEGLDDTETSKSNKS